MKPGAKTLSAVFLATAIALLALLIMRSEPARREATFFPMGGIPFSVVTYGRSEAEFEDDMASVRERVAHLERIFNRFKEESELSLVNRLDAGEKTKVGREMRRIVELSRNWHAATRGAFDPTVTPLVDLWKAAALADEIPDESGLSDALSRVGFDKVRMEAGVVSFDNRGMSLDFGAIAKGFMADEIAGLLVRRGVARGVIDAGGNALAFGTGSFRFGVQDPLEERGVLMGALDVSMGGVVTSGSYERFVTIGGTRYSHLIDPRDGVPVENGMIAATVVGGTGAGADSLATALMVLGREEGARLVQSLSGYEALLVEEGPQGPQLWVSRGMAPRLVLTKEWFDRVKLF